LRWLLNSVNGWWCGDRGGWYGGNASIRGWSHRSIRPSMMKYVFVLFFRIFCFSYLSFLLYYFVRWELCFENFAYVYYISDLFVACIFELFDDNALWYLTYYIMLQIELLYHYIQGISIDFCVLKLLYMTYYDCIIFI
jgi:hypothetical protein